MSDLSAWEREGVHLVERDARAAEREIHTAQTRYGTIVFTDHGDGHGEIWCEDVITVNRRDHVLFGGYTKILEWAENDEGLWRPDPQKMLIVFWDPGLRRLDGSMPTDNALLAVGRAVGKVMSAEPWMTF